MGDLEALADPPVTGPVSEPGVGAPSGIAVEAAVQAVMGACAAGGAGGMPIEDLVRGVPASSLAKVLVNRVRRRVARALGPLRP